MGVGQEHFARNEIDMMTRCSSENLERRTPGPSLRVAMLHGKAAMPVNISARLATIGGQRAHGASINLRADPKRAA